MNRKRDEKTAELFVTGRDIEEAKSYALRWSQMNAEWTIAGEDIPRAKTPERQRIIDFMITLDHGLTAQDVAEQLGADYDTIRKMMARMYEDSELTIDGGNKRTGYVYRIPFHNLGNYPNLPNLDNHEGEVGKDGKVGQCFPNATAEDYKRASQGE